MRNQLLTISREGESREYKSGFSIIDSVPEIDNFLHPTEISFYNNLEYDKRKKSYLLGRFAAKEAITTLHPELKAVNICITKGVFEFPVVEHKNLGISISHSNGVGAAIAYPLQHPIAIDIEYIDEKRSKAIESRMTSDELKFITCNTKDLVLLWSIKESLSKALKCGLTIDFKLLELSSLSHSNGTYTAYFTNFSQYKAIAFEVNGFICALVIPRKSSFMV